MATNAPFGFKPYAHLQGLPWNTRINGYREIKPVDGVVVAGALTPAIFQGDPVRVDRTGAANNGYIIPALTATGDVPILGIFLGCEYTDSSGTLQRSPFWPSVPVKAFTTIKVFTIEDPYVIYTAQTTAAVGGAELGDFDQNYPFFRPTVAPIGDTSSGQSLCTVNLDGVSGAASVFKVIGVTPIIGNNVGEQYNQALVLINNHYYKASTPNAA